MSKVVKGIGRAVSKVVKGVVKAVKKFAKSKIGKFLLVAAAVYFGGAALMGGFSGATTAAGTVATGLEGAAAGIGNAWTSLGTAVSQAGGAITGAEGASFANAGNALSSGFGGNAATIAADGGQLLVNGALPSAMPVQTASSLMPNGLPVNPSDAQVGNYITNAGQQAMFGQQATNSTGLIGKLMASPYAAPALVSTGGQLISGVMQGVGNQKIYEQQKADQKQLTDNERARYNNNVGTRLYG